MKNPKENSFRNAMRELYNAIDTQSIRSIIKAIDNGASLNSKAEGHTLFPLDYAISKEWWNGVKAMSMTVNLPDTIIIDAVKHKQPPAVKLLLQQLPGLVSDKRLLGSCLFHAVDNNDNEMIALLLEFGANKAVTKEKETPIAYAARQLKLDCVKELVVGSTSRDDDLQYGKTLISVLNHGSLEIAELLLKNDAPVSRNCLQIAVDSRRNDLIDLVLSYNTDKTILNIIIDTQDRSFIQKAIQKGALLNEKMKNDNHLPLHYACEKKWWDGIMTMLESSKETLTYTTQHCEVLEAAIKQQQLEPVNLLLQKMPALISSKTFLGFYLGSYLFVAIDNNDTDMIALLLEFGANMAVINSEKQTPIHYAASHSKKNCVRALIQGKTNKYDAFQYGEALNYLVSYNELELVKLLLEQRAPLNKKMDEKSCLHLAIDKSNRRMVELLLAYNADMIIGNPIIYAATQKQWACVISLAQKNENQKDLSGYSQAFLLAVENNQHYVATYLLKKGANVQKKNSAFNGALHIALMKKHDLMFAILLNMNIDRMAKNGNNLTPQAFAKQNNLQEVYESGFEIYYRMPPKDKFIKLFQSFDWFITLIVLVKNKPENWLLNWVVSREKEIFHKIIEYYMGFDISDDILNEVMRNKELMIKHECAKVLILHAENFIEDFKSSFYIPHSKEANVFVDKLKELMEIVSYQKEETVISLRTAIQRFKTDNCNNPKSSTMKLLRKHNLSFFSSSSNSKDNIKDEKYQEVQDGEWQVMDKEGERSNLDLK